MEFTSDDEETVSTVEYDISTTANHTERPSTPDTQCSICLGDIINKCYSNECSHLFCYECLKRWSNIIPTCPICKTFFTHIYHTVSEQGVYETYNVPREIPEAIPFQEFHELTITFDANRLSLFRDILNITNLINNHNDDSGASFLEPIEDPVTHTLTMDHATRVLEYIENSLAEPLPDSSGQYRDRSSAFFRNNPSQTHSTSDPTPDDQPGPTINETIVLDSDDEVDQMTTMADIVPSSDSDGSDVELIPSSSINNLSSSLMDQASTSTAIQDSLVRPNKRRKLVTPTVNGSSSIPVQISEIAHGIRRRHVLDTSSDDEELNTASQTQARTKFLKKKRKTKKN